MKKTAHEDDDSQMNLLSMFNSSKIKQQNRQFREFTFFLDEAIGEPSKYRDEIHTLLTASENDVITLVINSPGGQLNSAAAIVECIKNTEAQVTALILQECSSAATIIALNCPQVIVSDSAEFMIHTGKFGSVGTANNVKDHVSFTYNQINKLIEETYAGFLTQAEIEQVKNGVEFWYDAEETKRRFRNRAKFVQLQEKKRLKAEAKQLEEES